MVDLGTLGSVTLVSAHAGAGKTVLLSAWAASNPPLDVAWLTLERDDNWSPAFWSAVDAALNGDRAHSGREATAAHVSKRLSARDAPIALVLDDFHEIENKVLLREVDALLARSPRQLRLVISTRADPHLRLQRLRLAGELTEIRACDLAFTSEECTAFLGRLAERLSGGDIEALTERTEGWAAGIRLAALSLERQVDPAEFIRRFAGDDRAVADYLLNEVLERQTPQRREFLLRTSVPDTLSVGLAGELSGDAHSGRVLEELTMQNVLISTEAGSERRYRYPGLLRSFLQAHLARTKPEELRALYRRAARWHRDGGEALVAFREAIAGEDWELAENIYEDAWPSLVLRPLTTSRPDLPSLPPEALPGRPGLMLEAAFAELVAPSIDFSLVEQLLARAGESFEDDDASPPVFESLETHLTFLRLVLARVRGDFGALESTAQRLLEASKNHAFASAGPAHVLQAIALTNLGTASVANGRLDEAERRLEQALVFAREAGANLQELNSLSQLALVETSRGNLRRAAELATEATTFADHRGWFDNVQTLGAHFSLAWAHYQWNELEVAETHLRRMEDGAVMDESARLSAAVLKALLFGARGAKGAEQGLRLLRGSLAGRNDARPLPFYLNSMLDLAEPRLLAARGDLDGARKVLGRYDGNAPDGLEVLLARLLLVDGDPEGALAALANVEVGPGPEQRPLEIEAAVLKAVAHGELHDTRASTAAFEHALELGDADSYRRVFVDVGPSVRPLLESQIRHGTSHRSFAGELVAAFERRAPSVEITKLELLEPLSERERAVLRYLPTLMSNSEIASELYVSVNTVKTHLRSIYRKLGAARRRDAVERARRLELL
jgi:LuxR family transcriptional regulator, maltose regulon positive regulatory protein